MWSSVLSVFSGNLLKITQDLSVASKKAVYEFKEVSPVPAFLSKDFLKIKLKANRFDYDFEKRPLVCVFRECTPDVKFDKNDSTNNCDTIALVDKNDFILLNGRSFPHITYMKKYKDTATNYIASCYVDLAYRKGPHRGYPALRQNVKFPIWRSKDLVLKNDDDYLNYAVVGDNFHAHAPFSAGCVTVQGTPTLKDRGQVLSGDWKKAHEWIYHKHKDKTFFDACLFDYSDIVTPYSLTLRYGSSGVEVKALQKFFKVKPDGQFGPVVFDKVISWQRENNFNDNGIIYENQYKQILNDMTLSDFY